MVILSCVTFLPDERYTVIKSLICMTPRVSIVPNDLPRHDLNLELVTLYLHHDVATQFPHISQLSHFRSLVIYQVDMSH
jgi:hypothetical protein